jgi:hypothetical protein
MKATPKQLAFLGVFFVAVMATCAVVAYRAVAPTPRNRGASASRSVRPASESGSQADRQPAGGRSSYRSSSPAWASPAEPRPGRSREATAVRRDSPPTAAGNRSSGPSRPAPTLDKPELVTYSLDDYLTIAERDPFKPIVPQRQPKPAVARGPSSFNSGFSNIPAPVVISDANRNAASAVTPPTPPTPPPPPPPPTPPPAPEAPKDIAVTGFVQSPEGWFILLENVTTQEARQVGLGEEEFGYRIQSIDVAKKRVVLEKDGQQIPLRIGDNKKEVRPEKKAPEGPPQGGANPPGSTGAPGGGWPGFGGAPPMGDMGANPWGQMPPNFLQGFQNWQRRRGRGQG